MSRASRKEFVLGFHPFTRGFAFSLFESPLSPIDWRNVRVSWKEMDAGVARARKIIEQHRPSVLVVQDGADKHGRRSEQALAFQDHVQVLAEGMAIRTYAFDREAIKYCFKGVGAKNRYQIAQAIAARVDAFRPLLPPPRKLWDAEHINMALFQSASLVMTYYCQRGKCEPSAKRAAGGHFDV